MRSFRGAEQKGKQNFGDSEIILTFALLEPSKPLYEAQMCGSFY